MARIGFGKEDVYRRIVRNTKLKCRYCGQNYRWRLAALCRSCYWKKKYHGHPGATKIHPAQLKQEREDCQKLIDLNRASKPIQAGVAEIERIFKLVMANNPIVPHGRRILRLIRHEVEPIEILVELCAAQLFYDRNYPVTVKDDTHFTHLVGNRILRYVPTMQSLSGDILYAVGSFWIKRLGVLMLNVARNVERMYSKQERDKRELGGELEF